MAFLGFFHLFLSFLASFVLFCFFSCPLLTCGLLSPFWTTIETRAFNTFLLPLKQSMGNSAKRRNWPAAVGVYEYDDCISLSSGIAILLFSWCSFPFVTLQKYQCVMFLFRFDQKNSLDRKKVLFSLALCVLQQQLVILCWKFSSPERFSSDQWLHSKSPRNIYDQMIPLPEPDWHMRRPLLL